MLCSLLHAFVSCRLDYCNSLMAGLPLCYVKRLPTFQNAAAHLFGSVSRWNSVLPVLCDELHWLPIKQRIDFKVGVISFKAMNGPAPSYLVEMFLPILSNPALHQNRLADRGTLLSRKTRTWASKLFNSLPFFLEQPNYKSMNLCSSSSLIEFKTNLKTDLFAVAYSI